MANGIYDIITVGGGLSGSALAKAMAEHGARVLVLEREKQFKDRVRGEAIHPWGVAEMRELGIYELLRDTCGHEAPWRDTYLGPRRIAHRDLLSTTPQQAAEFAFYHPTMQEVLLQAAVDAGAEVCRGVHARAVKPGALSTIVVEQNGHMEEVRTRLVVGADGRASMVRKWANFARQRDPEWLLIAGVLFEEMPVSQETSYIVINSAIGQLVAMFPQGQGRVRAYFGYQKGAYPRLQGAGDVPRLVEESVKTGAAAEWYAGARAIGPLATFSANDTWVEHPYREGVALVGDAAAASDPLYGEGLSLTVRDVRVLRDKLLAHEEWDAAGHAYAEEHDRYYGVLHTVGNWIEAMFLETGPEAEARRARALPLIAQDATRLPDLQGIGPDLPVDETARRRFFGEE